MEILWHVWVRGSTHPVWTANARTRLQAIACVAQATNFPPRTLVAIRHRPERPTHPRPRFPEDDEW